MEDPKDSRVVSITTTVATLSDARRLARAILGRRLAACVQVEDGLTSFYRWQGKECEDPEVRLTIKTLPAFVEPLQALLREEHPYDLPQFLVVEMRASAAYAAWVHAEVSA